MSDHLFILAIPYSVARSRLKWLSAALAYPYDLLFPTSVLLQRKKKATAFHGTLCDNSSASSQQVDGFPNPHASQCHTEVEKRHELKSRLGLEEGRDLRSVLFCPRLIPPFVQRDSTAESIRLAQVLKRCRRCRTRQSERLLTEVSMRAVCNLSFLLFLHFAHGYAFADGSVVNSREPLEVVKTDFDLADGAAASGNTLFVPDVKAKSLYVYRPTAKEKKWREVATGEATISGTFVQLGKLYAADNRGARILRSPIESIDFEEWGKFDDGARPNDLVVDVLGNAYVTCTKEGQVRRVAEDGSIAVVIEGLTTPNGITMSPDGSSIYVSQTKSGIIVRADVSADGGVSKPIEFARIEPTENGALADGMCID